MKTNFLIRFLTLIFGFGLLAAPTYALAGPEQPVLKLQVRSANRAIPSYDPHFPELLATSLQLVLSTQGLPLPVQELRPLEDPAKFPHVLRIDIADWRITSAGDLSCTLTATLKTPEGERRIGVYKDTLWQPGVIYSTLSRPYYPKTLDAVQALGRDLARSDLLSSSLASPAS